MGAKTNVATPLKTTVPTTPTPSGTFVPNKTPPPTDDAVAALKPGARAEKIATREGITSLTGKALTGEALAKFTKVYKNSALIRGSYNPDGTLKADTKPLVTD